MACAAIFTLIYVALCYSKHTLGRPSCQAQVDEPCETYLDEKQSRTPAAREAETLVQQHAHEPGRRSDTSTGSLEKDLPAEHPTAASTSVFVEGCMPAECLPTTTPCALEEVYPPAECPAAASHSALVEECMPVECLEAAGTLVLVGDAAPADCPVAAGSPSDSHTCSVRFLGCLSHVKAACRTLKKYGFLKNDPHERFPLNGHWQTEHGMTVVIDRKLVQWSPKRASKLKFRGIQRRMCLLSIYGETSAGHLITPTTPNDRKMLKWSNGDVWYSLDGCRVGRTVLICQTMTKVQRDARQDIRARSEVAATLRLVSKRCLPLLPECLEQVKQYIGSSMYYVEIQFETEEGPSWMLGDSGVEFLASFSRSHPHVEIQHCMLD